MVLWRGESARKAACLSVPCLRPVAVNTEGGTTLSRVSICHACSSAYTAPMADHSPVPAWAPSISVSLTRICRSDSQISSHDNACRCRWPTAAERRLRRFDCPSPRPPPRRPCCRHACGLVARVVPSRSRVCHSHIGQASWLGSHTAPVMINRREVTVTLTPARMLLLSALCSGAAGQFRSPCSKARHHRHHRPHRRVSTAGARAKDQRRECLYLSCPAAGRRTSRPLLLLRMSPEVRRSQMEWVDLRMA